MAAPGPPCEGNAPWESYPPIPTSTQLGVGPAFAPQDRQQDDAVAAIRKLSPAQAEEVQRRFRRETRAIRRKRALLLSLGIHAAVLAVVNALTWTAWEQTKNDGGPAVPEHGAERGAERGHDGARPRDGNAWPTLPPLPWRGSTEGAGHDHTESGFDVPWPAWTTFGTATLFVFHAVNTLPLILTGRGRDGPHWNYWVVANLVTVVCVLWAVFALSGGFAEHRHMWPMYFSAMAAIAALVTSAAACCCGKRCHAAAGR